MNHATSKTAWVRAAIKAMIRHYDVKDLHKQLNGSLDLMDISFILSRLATNGEIRVARRGQGRRPTRYYPPTPISRAADADESLNHLAGIIFANAAAHGFHQAAEDRSEIENFAIWTTNIHGEVSELWEAARKGELTQHCGKVGCDLSCEEEEIADIIIRALDLAAARGLDIGQAVLAKHLYNCSRPHMHGGKKA